MLRNLNAACDFANPNEKMGIAFKIPLIWKMSGGQNLF